MRLMLLLMLYFLYVYPPPHHDCQICIHFSMLILVYYLLFIWLPMLCLWLYACPGVSHHHYTERICASYPAPNCTHLAPPQNLMCSLSFSFFTSQLSTHFAPNPPTSSFQSPQGSSVILKQSGTWCVFTNLISSSLLFVIIWETPLYIYMHTWYSKKTQENILQ